jgi:hypothetical protein
MLLATFVASATAATAGAKPSDRDFDRVQAAGRSALFKLGLMDARGCDRTNLRCVDSATNTEAAAFAKAVAVERSVARTLSVGKCKTAMLNRAGAYAKHASDVRKAKAAWHARNFQAAARYYYAEWAHGGRFDGLFVRDCS